MKVASHIEGFSVYRDPGPNAYLAKIVSFNPDGKKVTVQRVDNTGRPLLGSNPISVPLHSVQAL